MDIFGHELSKFQIDSGIDSETFTVETTRWSESCDEILAVRHKVFTIEQHFTEARTLCDLRDDNCYHLVVRNKEARVIATGRITAKGRIGKLAVLLPYRGLGIGSRMLQLLVQVGECKRVDDVSLAAELADRKFFDHHKFNISGPVFMKQGVPHQMLTRKLA
ncbi:MAG: GNAT family N-acetyltransferase [Kangiellaceae bacterium]|nr:GNAT family N-acetyltransferase [Kangiellaceae bacterium]